MKLLVNDKEISNYLLSLLDVRNRLKNIPLDEPHLAETMAWILEKKDENGKIPVEKFGAKLKDKLHSSIRRDLEDYVRKVQREIDFFKKKQQKFINTHLDYFLKKIGEEKILKKYRKSKVGGFSKSVGLDIDPKGVLVRRKHFNNAKEPCLLRNTVGNESLLVEKIDNQIPFWFIDSGYTNFIETNKKWHRLVRNHLHHNKIFSAPVDRLGIFTEFPKQWRTGGDRILIIEPGPFAASIFHVEIKKWKIWIEGELRKYTDKKIIFREKEPKKKRAPLYKHLLNEDYYCVVNINSNAATESIWAGIPVITLDKHISNPVSRSHINEINDLYRGPLAEWLTMISYSQFTYEELINGTAVKIVKNYHA